ncbi:AbrB/MazE/SpoVT family DNA-binding domain-containing protein [Nanoarchaeota archaeon]
MRRKIIRQGVGGNTIFLPVKWVRANDLNAGDEVDVEEAENKLIVSPGPGEKNDVFQLQLGEEYDRRILAIKLKVLYRLGHDQIRIKAHDIRQAKIIKKIVNSPELGFELVREKEELLEIESIIEPGEEKQDVMLRRMMFIVQEAFATVSYDLHVSRYINLKKMQDLNADINQYYAFCRRNIMKKRFTEKKASYYWEMYSRIALIEHSVLHLYEMLDKNRKVKISKPTVKLLEEVTEGFDQMVKGFYKEDVKQVQKVFAGFDDLFYRKILGRMKKSSGVESIVVSYIGEMSRLIYLTSVTMSSIMVG